MVTKIEDFQRLNALRRKVYPFDDRTPQHIRRLATMFNVNGMVYEIAKDIDRVICEWLDMFEKLDLLASNGKNEIEALNYIQSIAAKLEDPRMKSLLETMQKEAESNTIGLILPESVSGNEPTFIAIDELQAQRDREANCHHLYAAPMEGLNDKSVAKRCIYCGKRL